MVITITVAAVRFASPALGGIFLAALHRRKKAAPIPLALVHGVVLLVGLVRG